MTYPRKKIKDKKDNELVGVVFGLHRLFLISKESKFKLNAPKINDINKKRCLY